MLYIATDLEDSRWLAYLIEEFTRNVEAGFSVEIISTAHVPHDAKHVLYYCATPQTGPTIPNRSRIQPDGEIAWRDGNSFALPETITPNELFAVDVDLFWNAFVFLSRLEEYVSELSGRKLGSYCFRHPRKDKTTFEVPVVDLLFLELRALVSKCFPDLVFLAMHKPVVELSHDVDYLRKTLQYRLKQGVFCGFNILKQAGSPRSLGKNAAELIALLFKAGSYDHFNDWAALEQAHGLKSVFYVYAGCSRQSPRSWLLDPGYDVSKEKGLQKTLAALVDRGFEVGLHGSWKSAVDGRMLEREKARLEEALGARVTKVRQHWLRFEERFTPQAHEGLFDFDSTLGFNDRMGFRSGTACRHRLYNHLEQRPFTHLETPQVIMDANVFQYNAAHQSRMEQQAIRIMDRALSIQGSLFSISWHQRSYSSEYGWSYLYERILREFAGRMVGPPSVAGDMTCFTEQKNTMPA